jgi:L-fuconolactonase
LALCSQGKPERAHEKEERVQLVHDTQTGVAAQLEVIDAQVHANRVGPRWDSVDHDATLDCLIASMDAIGVDRLVVDEYTSLDADGRMLPGLVEADGYWRPRRPFSQRAVARQPSRFAYLGRVDRADPRMAEVMHGLRERPDGPRGLRLQHGSKRGIWSDPAWGAGEYDTYFETVAETGFPVFLIIAPHAGSVAPYARRFPTVAFVLDHMGAVSGLDRPGPDDTQADRLRRLDQVLRLAELPNVYVKWCHLERLAATAYPFPDVRDALYCLVDAFGANRVMFAGDATETTNPKKTDVPMTWSQAVHHIADDLRLDVEQKRMILGGTARAVLNWD